VGFYVPTTIIPLFCLTKIFFLAMTQYYVILPCAEKYHWDNSQWNIRWVFEKFLGHIIPVVLLGNLNGSEKVKTHFFRTTVWQRLKLVRSFSIVANFWSTIVPLKFSDICKASLNLVKSIPWPSHTKRLRKLVFTASLLDVQHLKDKCGDRQASSLVVSLGKTRNGIASTFEWLDW